MSNEQPNNPLHGVTLEVVLTKLVNHYDWDGLAQEIDINCFKNDPTVKSSLKFLRKTPWARDKVENLYISTFEKKSPWGNFSKKV
ncbi:MAG: VF530 family protein [Oceanicoccus sp.]